VGNGIVVVQKGYCKSPRMEYIVKQAEILSEKISQHYAHGKILTFLGIHY